MWGPELVTDEGNGVCQERRRCDACDGTIRSLSYSMDLVLTV